jgi:uncharacterized protein (DUF924 family)
MFAEILTFWFEELEPSQWWDKDDELDRLITERFSNIHEQARKCELFPWRKSAKGRLAEIIVLDQFSRNIYRNSPLAFANDALALALSQEAMSQEADEQLSPKERSFLYMPFMHSESLKIHEIAIALYEKNGIQQNLEFERKHQAIIQKFGRYPHRNEVLGRQSTNEEVSFLKQPDSSF